MDEEELEELESPEREQAAGGQKLRSSKSMELDSLFTKFMDRRDPELLAEVFELAASPLIRHSCGIVTDPEVAEDVVQDCFLSLLETIS